MKRCRPLRPHARTASRALFDPSQSSGCGVAKTKDSGIDFSWQVRNGIDLVSVTEVAHSVGHWGDRYLKKVFTPAEIQASLATDEGSRHQRLAARFAAKEAAMKALAWPGVAVAWTDFEVVRGPFGVPDLRLHGPAARRAGELGVRSCALSLSHDGDRAIAAVTLLCQSPESLPSGTP